MAFIKRKCVHFCNPPMMVVEGGSTVVDGSIGDLWRCDDCQRLWQCRFTWAFPGRVWGKPGWLIRFWFRNVRGGDVGMSIFEPAGVDPWEHSPIPAA